MAKEKKLRPCPVCKERKWHTGWNRHGFCVACIACGHKGPMMRNTDLARAAWNSKLYRLILWFKSL